jgi:cytoskeletal protein CcmA (bactofilin family)
MFNKSSDKLPALSPSKSPSVLGPTLTFKGELSADEDLVIQATVEGTIAHQTKNLIIGEHGKIRADIRASVIIVEGSVEGDLYGDEAVIVKKSGRVNGNVFAPRISLEDGATFNGRIEMKPLVAAAPATQRSSDEAAERILAGGPGVKQRTAAK